MMQQTMQPNPLIELKVNEKLYNQQPQQAREPYYPFMTVPNPYLPTGYDQMMGNQILNNVYGNRGLLQPYQIPVIKKYNVSLGGISGDHTKIAEIYEDILPSGVNLSLHSFNTLRERFNINNYVRSVFIKTGDGEEVVLNGNGTTKPEINKGTTSLTNLLSRVKFLEINPYHFSRLSNNPYTTIPRNFVMYRSCYPIKLDREKQVIQCSKTNVGMNIRIYGLTKSDITYFSSEEDDKLKSNVYREIEYYKIIKRQILEKEQSPNFIQMYTYYRAKKMNINFKQFDLLRNKIIVNNDNKQELINRLYEIINCDKNNINNILEIYKKYGIINNNEIPYGDINKIKSLIRDKEFNLISKLTSKELNEDDDNYVILSEAPTQNILNWATKTYEKDQLSSINKMIQTGFYSDEVWESILFQLYVALLCLYKNEIIINNFTLENNVFIKNVQNDTTNIGYWKYIINGIEYNVKNHGYLVVIDSSYIDIDDYSKYTISPDGKYYKIISTKFKDIREDVCETILKKIKDVFNENYFTSEFIKNGGTKPSDKILDLIKTINNYIKYIIDNEMDNIKKKKKNNKKKIKDNKKKKKKKKKNIPENYKEIIYKLEILPLEMLTKNKSFNYISNRIGTQLNSKEIETIINYDNELNIYKKKYKVGDILVKKIINAIYNYVMIIKIENETVNILNKNNDNYEIVEIDLNDLEIQTKEIEEDYKVGFNYSKLETYKI